MPRPPLGCAVVEVCGKGHAANQGQLPPVPGLGCLAKDTGLTEACCHLLAVGEAQPLKEPLLVPELCEAGLRESPGLGEWCLPG